jgi:hypothetical protein
MMDKEVLRQRIDIIDLIGKTVDLKKDGPRFKGLCPFHPDRKSLSLVVYPDTRTWQCFGCGKHGDAFQWVMELEKVDFPAALASLQEQYGDTESNVTTWSITDADGNLVAQHVRYDLPDGGKTYSWRRDGKDTLDDLHPADLPLYGLKHLFDMGTAAVESIIITEGEKAADALIKVGYAAVGTVTGASSCPHQEVFAPLIDFEARKCVWLDNDDAGRRHMDKVAHHLKAMDIQPYLIQWPDAPPKGDAFDYIQQGGNVQTLLDTAVPWEPVRESSPLMDNVTIYGYREQTLQAESPNNRYKNVTDSCCNGTPPDAVTVQADETQCDRVLAWVKETSGWWSTQELDTDLGFRDTQSKNYRRLVVHRLKEQGIIEPHPTVNKQFRYVDKRPARLDFKRASSAGVLSLKWLFGIEQRVNLYPGNLVVVAGSQNAGKSALLLNFIRMNMDQFPIVYFSSEMGDVELQERLKMFPNVSLEDWHFDAQSRSRDFHDVVIPDFVNIIDFLEVSDEFWKVNAKLTAITERLGTGLAIVALQKKEGALLGRGDSFSLERPRLYLSMDAPLGNGKLTIVKGKSWANPKVNPNGLTMKYTITGGCQFEATRDWGHT